MLLTGALPTSAAEVGPSSSSTRSSSEVQQPLGATAGSAAKRGRVSVRLKTPGGVPATVQLRGKRGKATVAKAAAGTKATRVTRMKPGWYAVRPQPVIVDGHLYLGTAEPARVRAKSGTAQGVRVTYRRVKVADRLDVTAITTSSIEVSWARLKGAEVKLRRSAGTKPPASVRKGTNVPIKGNTAKDQKLAAGQKYSYALFSKVDGRWGPAVTLRAGTAPAAGAAAAYAANPTTVIIPAGVSYQASPTGPTSVRVVLPASFANPVLGAAVALPVSTALPGGYLGRITSIAPDGRTVGLVPAALDEAFDYYDVNLTNWSGPDVQPEVLTDLDVIPGTSGFRSRQLSGAELPSCLKLSGGHQLTFRPSFKPAGDFSGKINKTWGVPTSAQLTVRAQVTLTGAADFKTTAELKCGLAFSKVFVQLTAAPVPISFLFSPTVGFNVKASTEVSNFGYAVTSGVAVTGKFGITGPSLTGTPIFGVQELTPVTKTNGEIGFTVGGEVVVGPGGGTKEMGVIAGLSGKLNLVEVTAGSKFPAPDPRWNNCLAVSGKTSLQFALSVKAWLHDWSYSDSVTLDALKQEWPWGAKHWPSGCENLKLNPITESVLGPGLTMVSDESAGSPNQWGHLDGFAPNEKVWLLSTGDISQSVGSPDVEASTTMGGDGSPALSALAGGLDTYDTAAYRVTVIPSGTRLHVRYLFASEEYPEWVGSSFNDVMGVFVNGVNCATTGTGDPVSVNTINSGSNAHLFVDNQAGAPGYNTTMDGLTVPLQCTVQVTPGQPVLVSVAVADTSDSILDSAVALVDKGIWSD